MQTIDRYVAAAFARNFLLGVSALTALYMFQMFLGELLDQDFPVQQLIIHDLMLVPHVFVQLTPLAVLLATVLTLSGFNRSNELTACYSIGIGLGRLVGVILSLVFMISCFTLVLQDHIIPPLYKKRTNYYWREMKKRTDFFLDVKQDKIWYRSKNIIYNLRTFDRNAQRIHGMAVYTFDEEFNLLQVVDAERADFTPDGWKLINGTVTIFNKDDPFPMNKHFDEQKLLIGEKPKDFEEIEKEVDGLRIKELWKYILRTKETGTDTKSYEVKFWARWSLSFIPLVMCLLGVPFAVRGRREGGLAKDLSLCLVVTFFYWLFYSVGLSLGTNGALPPLVAAWLPSALFAALAGVLITRRQA